MQHNTMGYKTIKFNTTIFLYRPAESEKHGEPRNQVPEESFKSEEGWQKIFNFHLISTECSI